MYFWNASHVILIFIWHVCRYYLDSLLISYLFPRWSGWYLIVNCIPASIFDRKPLPEDQIQYCITEKKDKRQQKAHVNAEFFRQLRLLLGILIPKTWSAESGLLIAVAASLIARSLSDIWMISNATQIESTIITMHKSGFRKALLRYFAALPLVIDTFTFTRKFPVLTCLW